MKQGRATVVLMATAALLHGALAPTTAPQNFEQSDASSSLALLLFLRERSCCRCLCRPRPLARALCSGISCWPSGPLPRRTANDGTVTPGRRRNRTPCSRALHAPVADSACRFPAQG